MTAAVALTAEERAELADSFRDFSAEVAPSSPLYRRLALGVAEDSDLLDLMGHAHPTQRRALLLLAAVHFLLLDGADHPLTTYYPSVADRLAAGDPRPAFRDFCLGAHRDALAGLLASRATQTNEVGRAAVLYPGLLAAAARVRRPLAVVEVGASAGLNLLLDRYGYRYEAEPTAGTAARQVTSGARDAELVIGCRLRGDPPPLGRPPVIAGRVGIDPHPLDVTDAADATWLAACVWPEHAARRELLAAALQVARQAPPPLRRDDAAGLARAASDLPGDAVLCVLHSAVMSYLDAEQRAEFVAAVTDLADRREVCWLSLEGANWRSFADEAATDGDFTSWSGPPPPDAPDEPHMLLTLVHVARGTEDRRVLARAHPHGRWIEWLDA